MRIGTERSQRKTRFLWFEAERIHFNNIEKIFAALLAGEKVVDPCDESVAAELEGMPASVEAESLGQLGAMFTRGAGKLIGATDAIDDISHFNECAVGVGV